MHFTIFICPLDKAKEIQLNTKPKIRHDSMTHGKQASCPAFLQHGLNVSPIQTHQVPHVLYIHIIHKLPNSGNGGRQGGDGHSLPARFRDPINVEDTTPIELYQSVSKMSQAK